MRLLDVERYLQRNGLGFRLSGEQELVGKCWVCGKPNHLYISKRTGQWHCFAGKCEASGGIISAIMHIESVSFAEASRIVASEVMPYVPSLKDELRDRLEHMDEEETERVAVDLPEEFEPCWGGKTWRVPRYLRDRGVPKWQLKRFGIGFCRKGQYIDRVVIPVRSLLGYSFTTRTAVDSSLRFLSGKHCGGLLFGWEGSLDAHDASLPVVIVEGPFDCLAVDRFGYPCLALLGKELRPAQLRQLRVLADRTFVLLLDPDTLLTVAKQVAKLRNVKVGMLRGAKDPAVATKAQIDAAIDGAIDRGRLVGVTLRARLAGCT